MAQFLTIIAFIAVLSAYYSAQPIRKFRIKPFTIRTEECPVILPQHAPKPLSRRASTRIINGDESNELSSYLALLIKADNTTCTGSLIAPKLIITSASCATSVITAHIGATDILSGSIVNATRRIIDRRFNASDESTRQYDVGLIEIERESTRAKYMRISINPSLPTKGSFVRVAGHGETNGTGSTNDVFKFLYQVDLPVTECTSGSFNLTNQGCAGYNDRICGPCRSDEGAPVIQYDSSSEPVLVGIYSHPSPSSPTSKCNSFSPTLFTRTAQYEDLFRFYAVQTEHLTNSAIQRSGPTVSPSPSSSFSIDLMTESPEVSNPGPLDPIVSPEASISPFDPIISVTPLPSLLPSPIAESSSNGLSTGGIVGIVIGAVFFLLILIGLIITWRRSTANNVI